MSYFTNLTNQLATKMVIKKRLMLGAFCLALLVGFPQAMLAQEGRAPTPSTQKGAPAHLNIPLVSAIADSLEWLVGRIININGGVAWFKDKLAVEGEFSAALSVTHEANPQINTRSIGDAFIAYSVKLNSDGKFAFKAAVYKLQNNNIYASGSKPEPTLKRNHYERPYLQDPIRLPRFIDSLTVMEFTYDQTLEGTKQILDLKFLDASIRGYLVKWGQDENWVALGASLGTGVIPKVDYVNLDRSQVYLPDGSVALATPGSYNQSTMGYFRAGLLAELVLQFSDSWRFETEFTYSRKNKFYTWAGDEYPETISTAAQTLKAFQKFNSEEVLVHLELSKTVKELIKRQVQGKPVNTTRERRVGIFIDFRPYQNQFYANPLFGAELNLTPHPVLKAGASITF